ncbi:MAG TPA: mechanosensitive ion channel family protein [Longimicrobiales bacterium]|nr:mechanosensitive ion channel family protein [Longimicrobiales bacterium]
MPEWIRELLNDPVAQAALGVSALAVASLLIHLVVRPYVLKLAHVVVKRTRVEWDEVLFEARVPHRVSALIPLLLFQIGLDWVPALGEGFEGFLRSLATACVILVIALSIDSLLSAGHAFYQRLPLAPNRPIKSYIQLLKIVVYAVSGIFIVAELANKEPWFFISGLGAMMAIILLIFRDTLLSLVASVQLTNNDLIRVGDWIEMPQFQADGDVVDIALNTVSVLNWDKTITVIPTHKFLEHSFKNWRNMYGVGRRIKRSLSIDMSTIRFLTPEEIEKFRRFVLLTDYIDRKVRELKEYNARYPDDPDLIINQRRLTNIGTFRAYVDAYLRNHPMISKELTFLVRQLEPTPDGLPIEIYVYTTDTRWTVYEGIQADIFDHLTAIIPEFGLRVFQRPSGYDVTTAIAERTPLRDVGRPALQPQPR